jgi:hypothetical protein
MAGKCRGELEIKNFRIFSKAVVTDLENTARWGRSSAVARSHAILGFCPNTYAFY